MPPEKTQSRRTPVQKRSRELADRVLDAAGDVVEEEGLGAASVQLIAERAGVATGSLYQYFEGRDAVLDGLVLRHVAAFQVVLAELFERRSFDDWRVGIETAIDAYADYYRTEPGFRALWFERQLDENLLATDKANNAVLAADLAQAFAPLMGASPKKLEFAFEIGVELGDALLGLAFRRKPNGDPKVIAEAKRVIVEYLSGYAAD
jgi:AcrR family transcriptional regulator